MLRNARIMKSLPLTIFESIPFIAWFTAFGAYGFFGNASTHATETQITPQKRTAPEYLTAGAGIGVRACSDRGKRIGPVFSSVEEAQDYLSRR